MTSNRRAYWGITIFLVVYIFLSTNWARTEVQTQKPRTDYEEDRKQLEFPKTENHNIMSDNDDVSDQVDFNLHNKKILLSVDQSSGGLRYYPTEKIDFKIQTKAVIYNSITKIVFNGKSIKSLARIDKQERIIYIDNIDQLHWQPGANQLYLEVYNGFQRVNTFMNFSLYGEFDSYPYKVQINQDSMKSTTCYSTETLEGIPVLTDLKINYVSSTDTNTISVLLNDTEISQHFLKTDLYSILKRTIELNPENNSIAVSLKDKDVRLPAAYYMLNLPDPASSDKKINMTDLLSNPLLRIESQNGAYFDKIDFSIMPSFSIDSKKLSDKLPLFIIQWSPFVYSCFSTVHSSFLTDLTMELIGFHSLANKLNFYYDLSDNKIRKRNTLLAFCENQVFFNPTVRHTSFHTDHVIDKSKINVASVLGVRLILNDIAPRAASILFYSVEAGIGTYFNTYSAAFHSRIQLTNIGLLKDVPFTFGFIYADYLDSGKSWFGLGFSISINSAQNKYNLQKVQDQNGNEIIMIRKD